MHLGFSQFSTLDFNGHKNWTLVEDNPDYWKAEDPNSPPWCRAKAPYYHWATDEPKNFKAVGKSYNFFQKNVIEILDSQCYNSIRQIS